MPETRKQPVSKYTADRNIPGAFEGETVTRRRFMVMTTHTAGGVATAAVLLPALGFAAGSAIFERAPVIWTPVGKPTDFPDDDYLPRVITTTQGIGEVGKTTVYMRRRNPDIDDVEGIARAAGDRRSGRRDLQPLHAPRLPGALDRRPPSASSARATAASTASRARSPAARRSARSTTSTRGCATARSRSGRATRSTRSSSASRASAIRASRSTASASTSTPAASRRRRTHETADASQAPSSRSRFQDSPARPGEAEKVKPLEQAKEAGIHVADWVDERTSLSGGVRWMFFRKVPKGTNWFYTLGSATMFAFVSQALTGVFLAMYYTPSPTQAYESARHITNDVFLGEFVRGMHKWGSSVMVILIFLHMARTFFFGAYKYPRELNWIIGVVLVILTFVMSLTGYLLPFDQRSYWATIVAANINGTGPLVGPFLSDFLRGGADFGATTLSRFYAIHMMLVPGLIAALIGAHLYLVAKLGTTAPPWLRADKDEKLREERV